MAFKQGENMAFYSGFNQQSMPQNTVANNGLYQQQQTLQDPNSGFFPTNPFYQTNQYGQQQVPQGYYGQSQQSFFEQPQQNFYSGTEGMQAQPIGYKNQMFGNYDDQNPFQRQMAYGSPNLPIQQQPFQQQRLNPQGFGQFAPPLQNNANYPVNQQYALGMPPPLNQQGFGPQGPATFNQDYLRTMANMRGQNIGTQPNIAPLNQQGYGPQGPAVFSDDYLRTMANVRGQEINAQQTNDQYLQQSETQALQARQNYLKTLEPQVNLPQAIDQMQQQQAQQRQAQQGSRSRRMGVF